MSEKDGYDAKAGWGNSSLRGHGVNSPAIVDTKDEAIKLLRARGATRDSAREAVRRAMDGRFAAVYANHGVVEVALMPENTMELL